MLDGHLKELLDKLSTGELQDLIEHAHRLLENRANPRPSGARNARSGAFDRRHDRYDCNFQATFIRHSVGPEGTTGSMRLYDAVVRDISQGGICIYTRTQLEMGEVLTVFLMSHAGLNKKKVFVEVRFLEDLGTYFKVGGMFVQQADTIAAERALLAQAKKS